MNEVERFAAWVAQFPSVKKAAARLGVTVGYIHNIEKSVRPISDGLRWVWFLQGGDPDRVTSKQIEIE